MAIEISTAEEFIALGNNRGTADSPIDVIITADLDFSEIENFAGFGTTVFYATIDGQNHTIKNIVTGTYGEFHFMYFGANSTLKNIRFSNNNISCTSYMKLFYASSGGSRDTNFTNIIFDNSNTMSASGEICLFDSTYNSAVYDKVCIEGSYTSSGSFYGIASAYASRTASTVIARNCFIAADIITKGQVTLFKTKYNYNCFTRCKITCPYNAYIYPFECSGVALYYCYAANTVTSSTSMPLTYTYGLTSNTFILVASYYDNTILLEGKDSSNGQPTENLKSVEWLRSQGWPI